MSDSQENSIIQPAAFSRAEAPAKKPLFAPSPVKIALLAIFLVLASAVLFMFNARAVRFDFNPDSDTIEIINGLPTYQLGERYLMLEGNYDITAALEGYYPFSANLTISSDPDQEFRFDLRKLPGIVEIVVVDADGEISNAEVFIDQELQGTTPITLGQVPAGSRDLFVDHPRYLPYQREIMVKGMVKFQLEQVTLSPAWADVSISSMPAGANILIDDQIVGVTPGVVEIIAGERTLKLKHPGYKIFESELEIIAQQDQTISEIVLIKSDGKIDIVSQPNGANITISGQYHGQTPLAISLSPSSDYELIATKAGYKSVKRRLTVEPEQDQSLRLTLKPVVGLIKLTVAPPGASLYVDDSFFGNPNQILELTARSHDLRIELPGYATYQTRVIPQPGLSQQLNIVMQTEEEARVSAIPQEVETSLGNILRFIIPEQFQMGARRREPGRRSNEIEKEVELTKAYYLAEKEISNQNYKVFDPGHDSGLLGRALLSDPDRPVVNISWEQAVRFCNWLSKQDGLPNAYQQQNGIWRLKDPATTGYRLPTEAEWAWAARYANGHTTTRFPWGDKMPPTPGSGNFADESAANMVPYSIAGYNDNFRGPAPSGTYLPNLLGIFDLAGNVSEWIGDYYSVTLSKETLVDPTGPDNGDYYVIRGSNYTHGRFSELRWTFRDYGSAPRPDVGFRIARYVE